MKRIALAAGLTAVSLAFGVARADEIQSGVLNPGNFPDVPQVSKFKRDVNAGTFSAHTMPGNFETVPQVSQFKRDVNAGTFSAHVMPGNFAPAPAVTHNYNDGAPKAPSVAQGSASGS
jgi:hypothetical protein